MRIKFKASVNAWLMALSLVCVSATTVAPTPAFAQAPATTASAAVAPSAAPSADIKPEAAAPAKKAEAAENPYGIEALWRTSDAVAKIVLLLLAIMSMGSWYIMVVKVLEQSKMNRQAKAAAKDFWSAGTVAQGATALDANSPFRFIAEAGLEATNKHSGLMGHIPLNDWISMSIHRSVERINSNMQGGLAFLATVGSTSPFVGLFGTVWGIYHALLSMGSAGESTLDKVAGPIGEALVMTALGLAVAIPAVLGYNALVRGNKAVIVKLNRFAHDLHAYLLTGARVGAAAGAQVVALKKS